MLKPEVYCCNFILMILISDLQYFPSVIFYKISYNFSNIFFDQYELYQKMSFRNRCIIAGANGIIRLSVPLLQGRNQKNIMKDVKIAAGKWQLQHFKSIESCYNKSPWFIFYKDELQQLYSKSYIFLLDWNLACFEWSVKKLNLPAEVSLTDNFRKSYDDGITDLRNTILPRTYKEFPAIRYSQVFEQKLGFAPNLSILDLLFCEGKRAAEFLSLESN